jgi:hypothetical protein
MVALALTFCCLFSSLIYAQKPVTNSVETWSDNGCKITQGMFTVPPGSTAANFNFQFNTSWQACQGPNRMDWIAFGIRALANGALMYECTDYWDRRPSQERPGPISSLTVGPGTYIVYLLSGRNSGVKVTYTLTSGGAPPGSGANPVVASRDNDCLQKPGAFSIGPGCTASNFRYRFDTPWLQCSGPQRLDQIAFTVRGPGGDVYEMREYWDRRPALERLGPLSNLVLGPGNYSVLLESGRNSYVTLFYDLTCPTAPPPGPAYESTDLLLKMETNFTKWYGKIRGSGNDSIFVKGEDKQHKQTFTWDQVSKDVIGYQEFTLPKSGRIYIIAEFRMDDRPEY